VSKVIRGGVVPGEVVDARTRADEIVAAAKEEAERLVSRARAEADAIREDARREGEEAGRAEAAATLLEAKQILEQTRTQAEPALVALAAKAARRVVRAELKQSPEQIVAIVREVLDRARRATSLTLRAHPADLPLLAKVAASAELVADDSLERGGCVLVSELGEVDARLEVQLDALERALVG